MVTPLIVYKASAGSGKTFTLATEYISLLVENPMNYRTILAVTFTNKATEEMKMRILSQLYGIWKQLPDSDDYVKTVQKKTGLDTKVISERAGISLSNLLNNYNYFRVETIDTFFQSVMRNMARELDLTTNLRIGLNDYQVEELAVDQLIADLSTTDAMLQWILRYIMENISDDKSWNVIGQIKQFGRHIFSDAYKDVSRTLEEKLAEPGFFDQYATRLRELRQSAEQRMKQFADTFFDILESEGLTVDDFSYGKSGLCSFFLKLRQGQFDEGIEGKRVTDSVGDPSKWYKKNHPRRDLIHALADSTLGSLLRQALDERPNQWRLFKSADLTLRHLSQLRLLSSIEQKVHELNQDANRFLLSDTQQLLHSLIGDSDSPFIFEKIGAQLEHVMIDEFQDTSTVQWQNFRVLLDEAMSHEGSSNLIVGDVKQSIYRWRAGDWRLLNDIESQFDARQVETRCLDTNYRSQRRIITFNNTFFQQAARLEYLSLQEINEAEADQLGRAYADVVQQIPEKRPDEGYVRIELLPAEDYQTQVFQRLTETVSELLETGATQQQIAILVRTNAVIPLIAQYFMEQKPEVTIVSDEAFRLDASNAVCLLINAMRLLVRPDDQLTKAAIAKSYHQDILQDYLGDGIHLLSVLAFHDDTQPSSLLPPPSTNLDALLPEAYIAHFSDLRSLPLYDLAERLYTIFGLECLTDQSAYVCAFYDQLVNYVNENAADISAFLTEWDETLCSKTIQSDETTGVRIFSIHKSKGLEYEHVIIPFCDWQLEKQSGNILWCQPTEAPFNDLPIVPVDYSQKQMMGTIFEADYRHEHLQNTVDNLNLLYVAFTRARSSLFVIGRRKASGTRSLLIEQTLPLLTDALRESDPNADILLEGLDDDTATIRLTYGTLPSTEKEASNISRTPAPSHPRTPEIIPHSSSNPFLQPYVPLPVAIRTFSSKVSFRQSNRSKAFVEAEDEEAARQQNYIQTGSILHEIFSTIRTTADIPDALQRLQSEGIIYDGTLTPERITGMLQKRLNDPRVADWFSGNWTLFNECSILSIEDGQVCQHRPDRVMTDGHQWIVVDFKFGSPKPEYHDQVRRYMQLLSDMTASDKSLTSHLSPLTSIKGYLWYVYSNLIEEVK